MSTTGEYRIIEHDVLGPLESESTVTISVDGRQLIAQAGEPIAATLLAHGIRSFRMMPDSGSRRGYFCGVGRCTDCLMVVDGELNVLTCVTPVREGMIVETQNGLGEWKVKSA
jgi:predicted molibdopterin-dependent oxidoreductase YjgC